MILRKEQKKQRVAELVEKYRANRSEYASQSYNEAQVRVDFINGLLEALGWDVGNAQNLPQYLREVIQEEPLQTEAEAAHKKKPDYTLRIDGKRKLFLEAKKPSVNLSTSKDSAFQVRSYGWSASLPVSVLTNFETLAIYDCRFKPGENDDVRIARVKLYQYEEYVTSFDELHDLLSKPSVASGILDEAFGMERKKKGAEPFDTFFLEQIETWREKIAESLIRNNQELDKSDLNYLVQQIIDRIIFLRICEDREIEKYEDLLHVTDYQELKHLFQQAERKYDSGLFNFIEDELSLKVELEDSVLIEVFRELYYPRSPYAFAVVDAKVLGDIYELFLSKELSITPNGDLDVQEKPEIRQSKGAVPTPGYIVDEIVKKALTPICAETPPAELSTLKVADISCGSGVFLLGAYEFLMNYHLDWYIKHRPSQHPDQIVRLSNGDWKLTLLEKNRILLNNIYGVDIDYQAVQVAKFSLLLKVLENVTLEEVNDYLKREKRAVLPNLSGNIQWGNSLIDSSYSTPDEGDDAESQLVEINPFDYESSFEAIFAEGGFDVILGNPPYTRIQNMKKYSPLEVRYFQSDSSCYKSASSNNFDKYYLFIERGLSLLKKGGTLGYIVPHKFFNIRAGGNLRDLIATNSYLLHITHFGVNQVFRGKTLTYTCILILGKKEIPQFTVEWVKDLDKWKYGQRGKIGCFLNSSITAEPWILIPEELRMVFSKIQQEDTKPLEEIAEIFVGVQTSADKIYIIKPMNVTDNTIEFLDSGKRQRKIERSILRPCLLDVQLDCFERPTHNTFIIFPYRITEEERAVLYSQDEMKSLFPLCWEYLCDYKKVLKMRDIQQPTKGTWYRYGRSQSLTKFNDKAKLIWPVLSLEPKYSYDDKNIVFTGGGNGPYYALRPRNDTELSISYIMAILSHPAFEAFIRSRASRFQGDYGSHGKQFVAKVPIKSIDFQDSTQKKVHNDIVRRVKRLVTFVDRASGAITPQQKILARRAIDRARRLLNAQIDDLYDLTEDDLDTVKNIDS